MARSGKIMYSAAMTRPNVIDATLCHTFQSIVLCLKLRLTASVIITSFKCNIAVCEEAQVPSRCLGLVGWGRPSKITRADNFQYKFKIVALGLF